MNPPGPAPRHLRKTKPDLNPREITFRKDAGQSFLAGAELLARTVGATLGPRGRNVMSEQDHTWTPLVTKDGVSVAEKVTLEEPVQNLAVQIIKEAAAKTCAQAGDGTTTATVLAAELYRAGYKLVAVGADPLQMKAGMELAAELVKKHLRKMAIQVSSPEDLAKVATISANGDEGIGATIAQAVKLVGADGVIEVRSGRSIEDELEIVEGMQLNSGMMSHAFSTSEERVESILENPFILLMEGPLQTMAEITPLLEKVHVAKRPLLILCDALGESAGKGLVLNTRKRTLVSCAVRPDSFGDRRRHQLEDIAVLTGGHALLSERNINLAALPLAALGEADEVIVTDKKMTIIRGRGDDAAIARRIEHIRGKAANAGGYEAEQQQRRLARMAGGIATIHVGGATEVSIKERKDRIEDALNATRAATEGGIVPGGGTALVRCEGPLEADIAQREDALPPDKRAGMKVVLSALSAPLRKIVTNAGLSDQVIHNAVRQADDDYYGFDARQEDYADLIDRGVIDPLAVVLSALTNAVSVAAMLLTCECAITLTNRPTE